MHPQRALRRSTSARTSGSVHSWRAYVPIGLLMLIALLGPLLVPYSPTKIVGAASLPLNAAHLFGTDQRGMDVLSRVIAGARIDTLIAAAATTFATVIGVLLGVACGMNEGRRGLAGWSARGLARFLDMLDAVPAIIVGLVLVALFGASGTTIVIAIGVVSLPRQAKLVRSAALKVRSDPYVDAARMAGASEHGILLGTVLPNSVRPALENVSAVFGIAITLEAALGFLGVGLPPPTPEWGAMIALGASEALNLRWWGATFPTLALILSVIAVSLAGGELLRRRT